MSGHLFSTRGLFHVLVLQVCRTLNQKEEELVQVPSWQCWVSYPTSMCPPGRSLNEYTGTGWLHIRNSFSGPILFNQRFTIWRIYILIKHQWYDLTCLHYRCSLANHILHPPPFSSILYSIIAKFHFQASASRGMAGICVLLRWPIMPANVCGFPLETFSRMTRTASFLS